MENIFNYKRFWLLVRKHANENRKIFLISFIVMILPVLYTLILSFVKKGPDTVFENYSSYLMLIGGIYTGMFFKEWRYKARAASYLMLPANALEKIALVLFYSLIVFIPVFTVVFYGSHIVISKIIHPGIPYSFIDQYRGLSPLPAVIIYAILPYTFFQSLVLLFSVWFKKRQTVMALGVIAILFIIIYIWNMVYIKWLTGLPRGGVNVIKQFALFPTDVQYSDKSIMYITSLLITNVSILIIAISTLLFYIASYLKLKEKEI